MNTVDIMWNPDASYISYFIIGEFMEVIGVKDYNTGLPEDIGVTAGPNGVKLQTATKSFHPLTFAYISSERADSYETNQVDSVGLSTIPVTALFTDSGASITAHQLVEDINGLKTAVKTITITSVNHQDASGKYYGIGQAVETAGAGKVSFIVEAPTAGSASFIFGVV